MVSTLLCVFDFKIASIFNEGSLLRVKIDICCNNMCNSDVVLKEWDVVLRGFECWMMCYELDETVYVRCVARLATSYDNEYVSCCGSAKMFQAIEC